MTIAVVGRENGRGNDYLLGENLGTISGGKGNDTIAGARHSVGGPGRDLISLVRPFGYEDDLGPLLTEVDSGGGADTLVLAPRGGVLDTGWPDETNQSPPEGIFDVDAGKGNDVVLWSGMASRSDSYGFQAQAGSDVLFLGPGADTAYVMNSRFAYVFLDPAAIAWTGTQDQLHLDSAFEFVDIWGFEPSDEIHLYGFDPNEIPTIEYGPFGFENNASRISFSDGSRIKLKDYDAETNGVTLIFQDDPLVVTQKGVLREEASLTKMIFAGSADDNLVATRNTPVIFAGQGDDIVRAKNSGAELYGEFSDDQLRGGNGADLIEGGFGDDVIRGRGQADTLLTGYGNDTVFGGNGDDVIIAEDGFNRLNGGRGNDVIRVKDGEFVIKAGAGNDHIVIERDSLTYTNEIFDLSGGNGADRFELSFSGNAPIVLRDFKPGKDTFVFSLRPGQSKRDARAELRSDLDEAYIGGYYSQDPGDALYVDSAGGRLFFHGLEPGDLSLSDFVFV